jgi:hypothetical protein
VHNPVERGEGHDLAAFGLFDHVTFGPSDPADLPDGTRSSNSCTYATCLSRRQKQGRFIILPLAWLTVLSPAEAVLCSHLMHVGKQSHGDFVQATPRFLADGLGLDPDRQERLLNRLQRKGILTVDFRAGKRYIRCDFDYLEKIIRSEQP